MLTQEILKQLLHYNPETGLFTWLVSNNRRIKVGAVAGCVNGEGYIAIGIDSVQRRAHRLAWFYVYGVWPKNGIDHVNHNKADNRIINLREATDRENSKNRPLAETNTSGVMGVSWNRRDKKWCASIKINGKQIYIGRFDKLECASQARRDANIIYEYHPNHGVK